MSHARVIPALIVMPYVAFTVEQHRLPDDVELIGKVVESESSADELVLTILNGAYRMTIDAEGMIVKTPTTAQYGAIAQLQWQGHASSPNGGTSPYDLIAHAAHQIRAGHNGPYDAQSLASHRRFATLPISEAADRLGKLGDPRLKEWLWKSYPQMGTVRI